VAKKVATEDIIKLNYILTLTKYLIFFITDLNDKKKCLLFKSSVSAGLLERVEGLFNFLLHLVLPFFVQCNMGYFLWLCMIYNSQVSLALYSCVVAQRSLTLCYCYSVCEHSSYPQPTIQTSPPRPLICTALSRLYRRWDEYINT